MNPALPLDELARAASRLPGGERSAARAAALASFAERGFPTLRDEDWKYTDLAPAVDVSRDWLAAGAPAGAKSLVSAGTSDRGVKPLPPPPMSSRPPRNCTASAMMSIAWRLWPLSRSSHSRHSRRPSMATGRPLARNRAQFSPCAPQTVTSK